MRYVVIYTVEEGFRTLAEGPFSEPEAFDRRSELFDVEGASGVQLIEYVER